MPAEKTEQDVERRIALARTPTAPIQNLCARSEFDTKNKSNWATRKIEPPHTHLDVTSKRFIQSKVHIKKNFRATKKMCRGMNFAKCKKNSRWRRVRRRTLPAATTPSPYASKLRRSNPSHSEQNCAEPSSCGDKTLPNETQRESKERHPNRIHPKPKENRPGGEFGAEPSPRGRHIRHSRANCHDRILPAANGIALNPPRVATKPSQTKPKESRRSDTQIKSTLNPKKITLGESSAPNPPHGDKTLAIAKVL